MKSTHFTLALASAFTLSACVGGGDDMTDSGDKFPLSGVGYSGSYTVHHLGRRANGSKDPAVVVPVNGNAIDIDGQIIPLVSAGHDFNQPFDIQRTGKSYKIIGTHLQHARYGYLKGVEKKGDSVHYIILGEETPDMPKTGAAIYLGHAYYNTDETHSKTGTAKFTANFATKELTGKITGQGIPALNLKANISGNNFSGRSNNVETNGAFYGEHAEEIAGTYTTGNGAGGFGATKQK